MMRARFLVGGTVIIIMMTLLNIAQAQDVPTPSGHVNPPTPSDPNTESRGLISPKQKALQLVATLEGNKALKWTQIISKDIRDKVKGGDKDKGESSTPLSYRDLIITLLADSDDQFKKAVSLYQNEKFKESYEIFDKISKSNHVNIFSEYLHYNSYYFIAKILQNSSKYEDAILYYNSILVNGRNYLAYTDDTALNLAVCYLKVADPHTDKDLANKLTESAKFLLRVLDFNENGETSFPDAPERIREAAHWHLAEIAGGGSGPLIELSQQMDQLENEIAQGKTGTSVQEKQARLVEQINKLIERESEKENNNKDNLGTNNKKKREVTRHKEENLSDKSPNMTDPKFRQAERDRELALQWLQDKVSPRYQSLVNQYFKSLAENDGKKHESKYEYHPPVFQVPHWAVEPEKKKTEMVIPWDESPEPVPPEGGHEEKKKRRPKRLNR